MRLFGPPLAFWTARFESKHRISKNIAESAKNFKNITLTVTVQQQMRMASIYYRGMFDTSPHTLPEKVQYKKDLKSTPENLMLMKVGQFMGPRDLVCNEIVLNHQKYRKEDLVVLEVSDGIEDLIVGVIGAIIVKNNKVFFVVRSYKAVKHALGYYESVQIGVDYQFVEAKNLADFKPLHKHGTSMKFQFVLHHHISHNII